MTSAILFQIQSFLVLGIMTWGIYLRCQRAIHIKMMTTAIIWDLILIAQIELTRGAINKAANSMMLTETTRLILNIHVALAVSSVLLYLCMIITGRKLLKGSLTIRPKHKVLGWTTYVVRILTFITSFWAVVPGVS
jgi:hypothetical protein